MVILIIRSYFDKLYFLLHSGKGREKTLPFLNSSERTEKGCFKQILCRFSKEIIFLMNFHIKPLQLR